MFACRWAARVHVPLGCPGPRPRGPGTHIRSRSAHTWSARPRQSPRNICAEPRTRSTSIATTTRSGFGLGSR